jgi:hypothetical protein
MVNCCCRVLAEEVSQLKAELKEVTVVAKGGHALEVRSRGNPALYAEGAVDTYIYSTMEHWLKIISKQQVFPLHSCRSCPRLGLQWRMSAFSTANAMLLGC